MSTEQIPTQTPEEIAAAASLMSAAGTQTAEQIAAAKVTADSAAAKAIEDAKGAPVEFKPDATKSQAENDAAKKLFDDATKAAADKKAADDTKTAAEKKAADEKAAANDTKTNPFKVEEIKLPEGMVIDPAVSKDFTAIVNEGGIPRDVVAKLIDLQAGFMKSTSERDTANWTKTQDEWKANVMADKVIGGDKNPEAMARVAFLRDTYGKDIPDLKQALDMTGAGNHPGFIKWIVNISQDLVEGKMVSANQPSLGAKSDAALIYDKT